MGMTYYARYRYANLADRYNGEAPYDHTAVAGGVAYGYREAGLWTGQWDFIRKRWHKILQQSDSYWRNHDWASGACDNKDSRPNSSVDITWDHETGLEALARCAYAIGDEKTYDFLCYLRARLSLTSVAHEAVQQYLQPYLMWPDHWFAGHIGEPYPPSRSGLKPEGSIAMQWMAPYPHGAVNQMPWRFNNANISSPGVGLRWMGMTQPHQARWMWNRMDKYIPDWYDGRLWKVSGNADPPYFNSTQRSSAANLLMVGLFAGISPERIRERFDRLSLTQALRPFYIERMAHSHGRGQLQNMLFTRSSPMWCSAWEPRVIWHGSYDPAKGAATIIVQPGDAPLRFKGSAWIKPLSIAINGKAAPLQQTVKQARLNNSWAYRADRQTIYIFSNERGRIELTIRFKPDPKAPKPAPRMVSAKPIAAFETNMLNNASFDIPHRNIAKAPFVGAVTGPYLYVNYWLAPDVGAGSSSPLLEGYMRLNGIKTHSAGVSVELFAGKDTQVRQNVPAMPGPHRLVVWAQLARRQWQPDDVELRITAAALNAGVGNIQPLTLTDLTLAPTQLHQDKWVPLILELDAPPKTNAI